LFLWHNRPWCRADFDGHIDYCGRSAWPASSVQSQNPNWTYLAQMTSKLPKNDYARREFGDAWKRKEAKTCSLELHGR
jgi:hypothetical protein